MRGGGGNVAGALGDAAVARRIGGAVHRPFGEAWRDYEAAAWDPVRRTLAKSIAAHGRALEALDADGTDGLAADGTETRRAEVPAQDGPEAYRANVLASVVAPLHDVLADAGFRSSGRALKTGLAEAAAQADAAVEALDAVADAPVRRGEGPVAARLLARLLWWRKVRAVPVRRLGRRHLVRVVLPRQLRIWRAGQRRRANWLGGVERTFAEWAGVVAVEGLDGPKGVSRPSGDGMGRDGPEGRVAAPSRERSDGVAGLGPRGPQSVRRAAQALDGALRRLAREVEAGWGVPAEAERLCDAELEANVAVAGFLNRGGGRGEGGGRSGGEGGGDEGANGGGGPVEQSSDVYAQAVKAIPADPTWSAAAWDRRAAETASRLRLHVLLLDSRARADAVRSRLRASWTASADEVDAKLLGMVARLDEARVRTLALDHPAPSPRSASSAAASPDASDLSLALGRERARIGDELGELEGALEAPAALRRALVEAADRAEAELRALAASLPRSLALHRVPRGGARRRTPGRAGRPLWLRRTASRFVAGSADGRVVQAGQSVERPMGRVHAIVAELREVVAYGYFAALEELAESGESNGSAPAPDSAPASPAAMAANSLVRAAAKVGDARAVLGDAMDTARREADGHVARGLLRWLRRSLASPAGASYLDARFGLARAVARLRERWRRRVSGAAVQSAAAVDAARSRLWPVRRALGMEAASHRGVAASLSSEAEREVVARLPLLYRRLFEFEPLDDPALLAGRSDQLAAVDDAWERWQSRRTGSLAVTFSPGAGVTSFLNIVVAHLNGKYTEPGVDRTAGAHGAGVPPPRSDAPDGVAGPPLVVRATLTDRPGSEAELAGRLAALLGHGDAPDLGALGSKILGEHSSGFYAPRRCAIIEGAEHVQLRVAGGGALLQRLLAFAARTRPRVFWVLSMPVSAWQLAAQRSPAATGDLDLVRLRPFDATAIARAINARHRLSGLPLRFVRPARTGWGAAALRAWSGTVRRQGLEADYFQRLHRAAQGSVRQAIFHWLRSADFKSVEGTLSVRPLEPPPPIGGILNLEQCFALKALLDHGTLTVSEYAQVARIPADIARHLFRSMLDMEAIEVSAQNPDRYRIRPLMTGAVAEHLRSTNILHDG